MSGAPDRPVGISFFAGPAPPAAPPPPEGTTPPRTRGPGIPADRCPLYISPAMHAAGIIAARERNIQIYKRSTAEAQVKLARTRNLLVGLGYDWKAERLDARLLLTEEIAAMINDMTRYKYYLERNKLMLKLQSRALREAQRKEQERVEGEARAAEADRVEMERLVEEARVLVEERAREVERMEREDAEAGAAAGRGRRLRRRAPARR
ncbi:hypothetical protein DFP73DRAFT_529823 [Morchella snyderi]|nr:hypothetical protein DFP73DRAFT_529823 [Morchella snyderi]